MSVESTDGNTCTCRWFVNGLAKTGEFVDRCLVPVIKSPPITHGKQKKLAAPETGSKYTEINEPDAY